MKADSVLANVMQSTLPNGVRMGILDLPHAHHVSIWVAAPGGCIYETRQTNGISHAVEHLQFSTTRRHQTRQALKRAMDRVAMHANAMLTDSAMYFTFSSPSEHAVEAIELLAECLEAREFDKEILRTELELLAVEMETMHQMSPDPMFHRIFKDHAANLADGGSPRTILNLQSDQISDFARKALAPDQLSVAIAGPISPEIARAAAHCFGELRAATNERLRPPEPPALRLPIYIRANSGRLGCVMFRFLRPAPTTPHDYYTCRLLVAGMNLISSPMSEELRYKLSGTYHCHVDHDCRAGIYFIEATAQTRMRDLNKVAVRIAQEFADIRNGRIDRDWFETARRNCLFSVQASLDDPSGFAKYIAWRGSSTCWVNEFSNSDDIAWLRNVRYEEIVSFAQRTFTLENLGMTFSARSRLFDTSRFRKLIEAVLR
ncbi:MAG: insulinase family protein [Phycisphaerae bacterium]|nr:insulinase family protein [Phycisphaerae bacterium]